jgi:hypothetical protein
MKNKFYIEDFTMIDGNVLVQPLPDINIKTLIPEPAEYSPVVKGKEDNKIKKIIKKYEKQPTLIKIGKVLLIPDSLKNKEGFEYKEGDYVIYRNGGMKMKLDLLTNKSDDVLCPIMMKSYEVFGKVNIEE